MFDVHNIENWKDRNVHRGLAKLAMELYIAVKEELHL